MEQAAMVAVNGDNDSLERTGKKLYMEIWKA
jgi:hypothetical protein